MTATWFPSLFDAAMMISTIIVYWLIRRIYLKVGLHPLAQPVLLGSAVMIALLLALDPYL